MEQDVRTADREKFVAAVRWAMIVTTLSGLVFGASPSSGMGASRGAFNAGASVSTAAPFRHSNPFHVNGRPHSRRAFDQEGAYYLDAGPYMTNETANDEMPPPNLEPYPYSQPPCASPSAPAAMFLNCGGAYEAPVFWPVRPPIGAVTPILPDGAAYEYVNGASYYIRGGVYYRPHVTRNGLQFEVVRNPS